MPNAKRLGGFCLLILTWLLLFYTLTFFTQLIMAPWDATPSIPALGTWQRTLNDFFELSLGRYLFSLPLILVSLALTLRTLRTHPALLSKLVRGNAVFFGLLCLVFYVAAMFNNSVLFPYPPVAYDPNYRGFHLSVFPMGVILAACAIWLFWQRRIKFRPNLAHEPL